MKQLNVSASRISAFDQCSYKYWCDYVEELPRKQHPKTLIGELCHLILKHLATRRYIYDMIRTGDFININRWPPLVRFIQYYQAKCSLPNELVYEVPDLLKTALIYTNFYHDGADEVFPPEHKDTLFLDDGTPYKVIIDSHARFGKLIFLRDFKSQKTKFTKADLPNNIQASIYQKYCWQKYGLPAQVEFVMLRHPPTKLTSDKHLQLVHPKTQDQLLGLDALIKCSYNAFREFSLKDAYSNFCSNEGFCRNVCNFYKPFKYQSIRKNGELVRNVFMDEEAKLKEGETLEIRRFSGCPKYNM